MSYYDKFSIQCIETHCIWISIVYGSNVYCNMDTHMNGHLTFLEWLVILATTIYILWSILL